MLALAHFTLVSHKGSEWNEIAAVWSSVYKGIYPVSSTMFLRGGVDTGCLLTPLLVF